MAEKEFNVGDVVRMRSEEGCMTSPPMTVSDVAPGEVLAVWYAIGSESYKVQGFPPECLVKISSRPSTLPTAI